MKNVKKKYSAGCETNTIFDRALKYIVDKYMLRFNGTSLEFEIALEKEKSGRY